MFPFGKPRGNYNASVRQTDRYRQLAHDAVAALPHSNRIRYVCVEGQGHLDRCTHSASDFETDLADFFLYAAKAGLIKVVHRG